MLHLIVGQKYPSILGVISILAFLFLGSVIPLSAATDDVRVAELKKAAEKEGKVVFYTSIAAADSPVFVGRFQKKYPFLKVDLVRLSNMGILTRVMAEHRANKNIVDVVDLKGDVIYSLQKMGILAKYLSPERGFFADRFKDKEGYWTDVYLTVHSLAYNTRTVSPNEVPVTYQDLLKPRWKGRIGFNPNNYMWPEAIMQIMGKEEGLKYLEALARQNPIVRYGGTLNAMLTAAGEVEIALPINDNNVDNLKERGAPVDWAKKIKPYWGDLHPIALVAKAPHPNASKLFIDFLLSQEGQEMVAQAGKIPPRTGLTTKTVRSEDVMPIDPTIEKTEYYQKLLKQIFENK